jgi:hypothetical protein
MNNRDWLFSLPLEEQYAWMNAEHQEPNPDCSAMLYKTFTGNMCSHYEPKDGVVAILREAARNLSDYHDAGEALRRLTDTTNVYHALETLADMVERDYVRRESIEEVMNNDRALVDENSMFARELLKLRVELEKATNNLNSANEDFENARAELVAERDEWKAKAESQSNLEWLYGYDDELAGYIDSYVADEGYGYAETLGLAHKWLTEPHMDDCGQNSDMPDACEDTDSAVCVQKCPNDSREKLENDVWSGCDHLTMLERGTVLVNVPWGRLLGWLDRQAEITKREWCDEQGFWNCAEDAVMLSAQVVQLIHERDELQSKLAEYEDRSMQFASLTGGTLYVGTKALTERIAELTAELDAAKQQISQFDAPKSVETSENPASKCEISDFDVWSVAYEIYCAGGYVDNGNEPNPPTDGIRELLDRQAAITAEETSNAWEEYRDATQREIAKYEHDCELLFDEKRELTAERDKAREESVELYSDLVKASDEREHYREKCSKMATIIHDALMVMDEGMA